MDPIRFKLPAYFQNGMILQQGITNRIFGLTEPDAELIVCLECFPTAEKGYSKRRNKKTKKDFGYVYTEKIWTDNKGFFDFYLPAFEASKQPYQLTLSVKNQKCIFKDIYFGEIWLALGESNMTMPVKYTDVKKNISRYLNLPNIRFFTMNREGVTDSTTYSYQPTAKIAEGKWQIVNEQTIDDLSAIGLAFAAGLQQDLQVPVGIFDLGCPNTMLYSWLSRDIIEENQIIKNHIKHIFHYRDKSNWNQEIIDSEINMRRATMKNLPDDYIDQSFGQIPDFCKKNQPAVMYNHKLAPFTGLSIRGIIFAQGESDVPYPKYYLEAFKAFSALLKASFHSFKRGPYFIYSQLASHYYTNRDDTLLPCFNEMLTAARRQLVLSAGMVTIYDLPLDYHDDCHDYANPLNPIAKEMIGQRMYQLSKGLVYQANSPKSAPEVKYAEWIENKLILSFAHVGDGLDTGNGDLDLKGFYINSDKTPYVTAKANQLYGIRTLIWHDEIKQPKSCAYAFSTFNQTANLRNKSAIPVVPFRLSREKPDFPLSHDWMSCDQLIGWIVPTPEKYRYQLPAERKPGYFPLWKITGGKSTLSLEKNNKISGSASIFMTFRKAADEPIILEPVLHYASLYPPLSFACWQNLEITLFNADHKVKTIVLRIRDIDGKTAESAPVIIKDVLIWQKITFDLPRQAVDLEQIVKLQFVFASDDNEGDLTIDCVQCRGIIESENLL